MKYTKPKGVFDILPDTSWKSSYYWDWIESILKKTAREFGFSEIRTPIFEKTELFIRGIGESSDIVSKEMYIFNDKADRSMCLRPEGTAPAMRAYIENHLETMKSSQKLFYIGPYFRYDRPQAGRYRQFHQFGAESIGSGDPLHDVEIIEFLLSCYHNLGLKNLTVLINSIGTLDDRNRYLEELKKFLHPHLEKLSKESQFRITKNPLRILDSKDPQDKQILQNAPKILDLLSKESKEKFGYILEMMQKLQIPYTIDHQLVRGLDYYNETVFEITSDVLGAQNVLGGGGRYDFLLSSLGGPSSPAVGFATGIERILLTLEGQSLLPKITTPVFVYIIPMDHNTKIKSYQLARKLRTLGIPTDIYLQGKKLQKALQYANDIQAKKVIVIGENELSSGEIVIKDMKSGNEETIMLEECGTFLAQLWSQYV